ncbi:unnamed protein product [Bathycoccus prasinos]
MIRVYSYRPTTLFSSKYYHSRVVLVVENARKSKIATPIFASSSSMQMCSVRTVANATLSKSFVGSVQRSFSRVNAFNQRGLLMSTEAHDSESPARKQNPPKKL